MFFQKRLFVCYGCLKDVSETLYVHWESNYLIQNNRNSSSPCETLSYTPVYIERKSNYYAIINSEYRKFIYTILEFTEFTELILQKVQ